MPQIRLENSMNNYLLEGYKVEVSYLQNWR